jgi:arylsulfatase/arylsulfatase A
MRGGILGELEKEPSGVRYTNPTLERAGKPVTRRGYATDVFFDTALAWIERVHGKGRPFFAYISTNAPHGPFDDVPEPEYRSYREAGLAGDEDELARIYAMVTRIDANVGKLFERLGELDLLEDTLVLYACDNGPNGARFNGGLRGAKSSVLEGGIRVPLLVHRPGTIAPGRLGELVAAHVDLAPTVLAACGVEHGPDDFDGRSFLPALLGEPFEPAERTLFFPSHQRADTTRNYAVRAGRWKLVRDDGYHAGEKARRARAQLFDLEADPTERRDLAAEHPDVVRDLQGRYASWLEELEEEVDLAARKPPVVVGSAHENPVLLTCPVGLATLDDETVEVEVARAGEYKLQLRFAPRREGGRSYLEAFNQTKRGGGVASRPDISHEWRLLKPGAVKCNYTLRLKPGRLRLDVTIPGGGIWQMQIERL